MNLFAQWQENVVTIYNWGTMNTSYINSSYTETLSSSANSTRYSRINGDNIELHAGVRYATSYPTIRITFNQTFNADAYSKMYISGTIYSHTQENQVGYMTAGIIVNGQVVASSSLESLPGNGSRRTRDFTDMMIDLSSVPKGSACSIFIQVGCVTSYSSWDYGDDGLYAGVYLRNMRLEK